MHYRLEGEAETEQSSVDPLDPCCSEKFPLYSLARPNAFILYPGEAVVIPQVFSPFRCQAHIGILMPLAIHLTALHCSHSHICLVL